MRVARRLFLVLAVILVVLLALPYLIAPFYRLSALSSPSAASRLHCRSP
jgi:hypothetical protein